MVAPDETTSRVTPRGVYWSLASDPKARLLSPTDLQDAMLALCAPRPERPDQRPVWDPQTVTHADMIEILGVLSALCERE